MGKLNTFFKVLLGIVLALILVGVTLFLAFYLRTPQGLHVVYDGVKYGNSAVGTSSTGISVVRSNSSEFAIGNSKGWGVYSADDCIVKIIPNVDEAHNFEFTVEGEEKPYLYSAISDLSAAFCEDYGGNGITITPDGTFTISRPLFIIARNVTPKRVPNTPPLPPAILVPPRATARMASISRFSPILLASAE